MEKLKLNKNYPAILICLVFLVIVGSYVVYNVYLLPEDLHQNQQQIIQPTHQPTLQPTLPSSSVIPTPTRRMCLSYVIDEVKPDSFMPDSMVVHVTGQELAEFPAIETDLQNATTIPAGDRYGPNIIDWFNGHRSVGGFNNDTQWYEFRNLSCKDSPDLACNPLNFTQEFEYMGRYYELQCYPNFAGAHDNLPPPLRTMISTSP
jgi:hypothetical protein